MFCKCLCISSSLPNSREQLRNMSLDGVQKPVLITLLFPSVIPESRNLHMKKRTIAWCRVRPLTYWVTLCKLHKTSEPQFSPLWNGTKGNASDGPRVVILQLNEITQSEALGATPLLFKDHILSRRDQLTVAEASSILHNLPSRHLARNH